MSDDQNLAEATRVDPGLSMRKSLSRQDFKDLFLSRDPGFVNSARGLRENISDVGNDGNRLYSLPAELEDDAMHLLGIIEAQYKDEGKPEFIASYDGVRYRCSMISGENEASDKPAHWCLRQVGSGLLDLADLSLAGDVSMMLRSAGSHRGLVIVSGFFGSGKSSTAAATLVDWVKTNGQSAICFEDPPEFPIAKSYEGGGIIHQVAYKEHNLSNLVARSKRWAPRYIMFGEIRDSISAAEALQAAVSGPMVICTIHSIDIIQALATMARLASKHIPSDETRQLLAASLRLAIHQDLVGGRPVARKFSLMKGDSFTARQKIETGRFSSLREDMPEDHTPFTMNRNL